MEVEAGTAKVCDTEKDHEACSSLDPLMASRRLIATEVVLIWVPQPKFRWVLIMSLWTEAAKACPGSRDLQMGSVLRAGPIGCQTSFWRLVFGQFMALGTEATNACAGMRGLQLGSVLRAGPSGRPSTSGRLWLYHLAEAPPVLARILLPPPHFAGAPPMWARLRTSPPLSSLSGAGNVATGHCAAPCIIVVVVDVDGDVSQGPAAAASSDSRWRAGP